MTSSPSRPNDYGSDLWIRDSQTQTRVSLHPSFIPFVKPSLPHIPNSNNTINTAPHIRSRSLRRPAGRKTLQRGKRVGEEEC